MDVSKTKSSFYRRLYVAWLIDTQRASNVPALTEVTGLVEKPSVADAPSNLIISGRYILQPEVMRVLENQEKGAGGEIQLTDAMATMIGNQAFHAVTFDGARYDCGSKAGYIQANLAVALQRPDIAAEVRAFAIDLLK